MLSIILLVIDFRKYIGMFHLFSDIGKATLVRNYSKYLST